VQVHGLVIDLGGHVVASGEQRWSPRRRRGRDREHDEQDDGREEKAVHGRNKTKTR
jgi:hypothetical protein